MSLEGNTVEVCQLWITADHVVVKVLRRGKAATEYVGKPLAEVVPLLEAEGWHESGRFVATDIAGAVRIAYQRTWNSG